MHSWPAFTAINEVRFGDADCVVVDLGLPPDPTHGPDAREQSQAHIVLESDEHEMLLDLETETSSGLEEKSLNQNDRVIAVDFVGSVMYTRLNQTYHLPQQASR
jgi:hypothetical protein